MRLTQRTRVWKRLHRKVMFRGRLLQRQAASLVNVETETNVGATMLNEVDEKVHDADTFGVANDVDDIETLKDGDTVEIVSDTDEDYMKLLCGCVYCADAAL
jgi:hypothetical protein